jgi:hypothetical protein
LKQFSTKFFQPKNKQCKKKIFLIRRLQIHNC